MCNITAIYIYIYMLIPPTTLPQSSSWHFSQRQ